MELLVPPARRRGVVSKRVLTVTRRQKEPRTLLVTSLRGNPLATDRLD